MPGLFVCAMEADSVSQTLQLATAQRRGVTIRRERLFSRNHWVVPAVAVREQVLSNNIGRMLLPAEEIEASVGAWNFTPVTLGHPKRSGRPVTARDPDVVNSRAVGIVFNARFEDAALKVDVFIDPEQARNVHGGEELLAGLERGEVGEVSTGFGFVAENETGEFDGKPFDLIARNLRPDHFAVGIQEGACSVEDGCGLGVNCKCGDDMDSENAEQVANTLWERIKAHLTRSEKMDKEQSQALHEATGLSEERLAEMEDEEIEALAANVLTDETEDEGRESDGANANNAPSGTDEIAELKREIAELKEAAEPALNEYRAEKARLVSELADNERCTFDEAELEAKGIDELRKLDAMATQRDYSGRGGPRSRSGGEVELGWEPEPVHVAQN